jgi:sodium/proline symporter
MSVIIVYLIFLLVIGVMSSKKSSGGLTDFFLAGRGLNKWTVALSAVSSGRSGWLVLGVTGTAYASGLLAVWSLAGFIIVEVFMFFYVASRFRKYSEKTDSITIPDILENRYSDKKNLLRITSSCIIVFFMIAYVGSQVVAGGTAFSTSLGLTQTGGMWFTAIVLLAYTMLGGFHAVSKTDVIQAGFMFLALVILPIVAIIGLGGFAPLLEAMHVQGPAYYGLFSFGFGATVGLLGIGFGSPGNPQILVRYMSLKNIKEMRQAALIGSIWNVIMGWGAIMIGLAGRAYFPDTSLLPGENSEAIFTTLGSELLNPFFMGILLVAILAAIMSSADSQLLVGASSLVRDIYQRIVGKGKDLEERKLVQYSRLAIVILMLLSVWLAFSAADFVFWMVLFAWGGLGACFGPALLLSFYWKKTTKQGVFWGMIVGLITVILVKKQPDWTFAFLPDVKALFGKLLFGVTYEAVPGFLMALFVTVIVSLFTKKPENAEETIDELAS